MDISVPRRERKSEHRERYSICRLLSTLAKTKFLSYPLSLKKDERPDFLLICNEQKIGIEVTEATSEAYSAYKALVKRERPGHFIEPSHFSYGKNPTMGQQRSLLSQNKLTGVPWSGDGAEKDWSLFIKDSISKKIEKLNQAGFKKFDISWLLIYDNTPKAILDYELLSPYLKELWPDDSSFDRIFVETSWPDENSGISDPKIIALSSKTIEYFSLENVWKKAS